MVTMSMNTYYYIVAWVLLLHTSRLLNSAVTISPSGVATVCSGDQLELNCTIADTGSFAVLVWNITLIPENAATSNSINHSRAIESAGPSDQILHLLINSTNLTFSRISPQSSFPLISRLLISPVSNHLNGTQVNCINSLTSESSSITVINISNGNPIQEVDGINLTEQYSFDKYGVTLTLEWIKTDPTHSYRVAVVPNLPLNFSTSSRVHIKVPYNSPHNVSVTVSSCGQHSTTIFFKEVSYSTCGNPQDLVSDVVQVFDFMEPAVEESTVTFVCPLGRTLNGSNISTCINGSWFPDPSRVNCAGTTTVTTTTASPLPQFPLVGTIVGSLFGVILLSIFFVIVVIGLLFREKIRGWSALHRTCKPEFESVNTDVELSPPHTYSDNVNNNFNTAERGLVYADIGQSSFNRLQRPLLSIPALEDTPIEYARINHKSLSDKQRNSPITFDDESLRVNLDNLLIQLRPQVGPRWYQFGEAVGISKDVLDKFVKQCSPEDCIIEMLDYWLRSSTKQPTWNDIAKILKAVNLPQLAHDIENVYSTGKLPIEVEATWIPPCPVQDDDFITAELPPPIPPKSLISTESVKSLSHRSQGIDCTRQKMPVTVENEPIPALPPKPNMLNIPPRPPK